MIGYTTPHFIIRLTDWDHPVWRRIPKRSVFVPNVFPQLRNLSSPGKSMSLLASWSRRPAQMPQVVHRPGSKAHKPLFAQCFYLWTPWISSCNSGNAPNLRGLQGPQLRYVEPLHLGVGSRCFQDTNMKIVSFQRLNGRKTSKNILYILYILYYRHIYIYNT